MTTQKEKQTAKQKRKTPIGKKCRKPRKKKKTLDY